MPRVPILNSLLSSTGINATMKGGNLINVALDVNK